MDFFERQEIARRNTKLLGVYFFLAVAGTITAIYFGITLVFLFNRPESNNDVTAQSLWNPQLLLGVVIGTVTVIVCSSVYKISQLSSGGKAVAEMLGGRLIQANTTDLNERKLVNVVEEMAIASGTAVPQIYVLPQEEGINAFAAGYSTNDMAICVTAGCMKLLTRDELQGVVGHEFSHILNGDMRLNLRLMGFVFGILCLAIIGRILLRSGYYSSNNRKGSNPLPLLGIVLLIIGYVGVFFCKLIKSAISRQREFLADASSVQFTRNPAGLANALKKILTRGSRIDDPNAEDTSHLFFANGLSESLFSWMSTHPPLEERIRELQPDWDGKPISAHDMATSAAASIAEKTTTSQTAGENAFPPQLAKALGMTVLSSAAFPVVASAGLTGKVGVSTPQHLDYAADVISKIPEALSIAARDPMGAVSLIYTLLLSRDESHRTEQLQSLQAGPAIQQEMARLIPLALELDSRAKLPLVTLSMSALRNLSPAQYGEFTKSIQSIIESDGQIDLFEYMLQKIVRRNLEPHFQTQVKPVIQYYVIKPVLPDCVVLLSALANSGSSDPAQIQNAYSQGAQELPLSSDALKVLDASACGIDEIDSALGRLNQTTPQIKKMVLHACAETVAADGVIEENEAELLRAIADTLDCPIPPFITI